MNPWDRISVDPKAFERDVLEFSAETKQLAQRVALEPGYRSQLRETIDRLTTEKQRLEALSASAPADDELATELSEGTLDLMFVEEETGLTSLRLDHFLELLSHRRGGASGGGSGGNEPLRREPQMFRNVSSRPPRS